MTLKINYSGNWVVGLILIYCLIWVMYLWEKAWINQKFYSI